jgi:hypothetical protein
MTVFNTTNQNRVEKIVELLGLLQKSAESNGATSEELWQLLERAIDAMGKLLEQQPSKPEAVPQNTTKEVPRMQIKRIAEEASLQDLTMAMAVYLNRIDEHLHSKKED